MRVLRGLVVGLVLTMVSGAVVRHVSGVLSGDGGIDNSVETITGVVCACLPESTVVITEGSIPVQRSVVGRAEVWRVTTEGVLGVRDFREVRNEGEGETARREVGAVFTTGGSLYPARPVVGMTPSMGVVERMPVDCTLVRSFVPGCMATALVLETRVCWAVIAVPTKDFARSLDCTEF